MRRLGFGIVGLSGLSVLLAHAHVPVPDLHSVGAAYLVAGAPGTGSRATEWIVEVNRLSGQSWNRVVRGGETVSLSLRNPDDKDIDIAVVLSESEVMTPMTGTQPVTIHLLAGERQQWRMPAITPLRIFVYALP